MDYIDKIKLEQTKHIFERNFKITRMYAEYLERYPEVICEDMISALTEDGSISKEEAVVALLSEIFALNFENAEDRALIRDYLTPSVRLLDKRKYESNPYYKNIKLDNIKDGNWEIRIDPAPPAPLRSPRIRID